MNEFLNQVYFNNSIRAYITVGAIILIIILFKKYIARYVAIVIFKILKLRWKNVDMPTFLALIAKPLGLFLAIIVTVTALDKLKLPHELDFKIYRIDFKELLRMTGSFLIIGSFFLFIIKCIDFIMLMIQGRYLQSTEKGNHQLLFFFKDLIKAVIGITGVLIILKYTFGYDVQALLAGLGIVGVGIALAMKESLENLIASFIIFFDKPFATGDAVKLNNVSGTVEKIGLRSTRIRSDAKSYITVPNKQMVDSILDNQSMRTQRRAELKLEISSSTTPAAVEQLLNGVRAVLGKKEILSYTAFVNGITANAIIINCEYFTSADINLYNRTREQVTIEILSLLENLKISTSGSVSDIKIIRQEPPENSSEAN